VHRLLQLRPGGEALVDRDNPLDVDLLVVDEASMLDLILANKLIKAVPPGAHVLLVGDVDQLPSVGAGEVLRDLLAAETIPRVRLTQVFRQAAQSGVVTNAHRINAGKPPITTGLTDFYLFAWDDTEATASLTVDVACTRIPTRFGLDPRRDIQVLTPMHRGPAGAGALNTLLQQRLTPGRDGQPERRAGGRVFRTPGVVEDAFCGASCGAGSPGCLVHLCGGYGTVGEQDERFGQLPWICDVGVGGEVEEHVVYPATEVVAAWASTLSGAASAMAFTKAQPR
jgi:ATP-dependent exoDNAse (exonuclease V) alpha subunit